MNFYHFKMELFELFPKGSGNEQWQLEYVVIKIIITNYKKNSMNLAVFLHNQKQFRDSDLPLPLAPLYVLPHQKWYFSSSTLTPLRKRRENTSFFKYLQEIQTLSQKQEQNKPITFSNSYREILCVYEKINYFDNKIKHIFDVIYTSFAQNRNQIKEKIKCDCSQYLDDDSSKNFVTNMEVIKKCLYSSRKNAKNEVLTSEYQKINWYQFAKNLILQQLQIQANSIPQQSLNLYKLPQTSSNISPYIFNVLWSDNYVIFNNGNKLEINQNMKAKAVELCESLNKKIQQCIWNKIQSFIPKVAEEVCDHQRFLHFLKEKIKVSTFKLWFYKKDQNNQIYILNLSHLTLKGVDCITYNSFNIKSGHLNQQTLQVASFYKQEQLKDITQLNKSLQNKKKAFSVSSKTHKSHKALINLLNPNDTQGMKNIIFPKNLEVTIAKQKYIQQDQGQKLTQIQCQCCKDLLAANQIVNQLTANHIQEIRYLRQIKIGKNEHSPYDFVKICTLCYTAYIKHHKQQSFDKRNLSQKDKTMSKNSQSFLDKGASNFQDYKSRNYSSKTNNQEARRLFFSKGLKERAKSQLNKSKQGQVSMNEDRILAKDRSISMHPSLAQPPRPKSKKMETKKTTNSQNTINHRQELTDLNTSKFLIQRSQTQQQNLILSNPNSIKFKNKLPNKTNNLINCIISGSFETKMVAENEGSPAEEAVQNINAKIIINAIDEYQKIDRMSFKKIVTKNHRKYMIHHPSRQRLQKGQCIEGEWKKSIRSYFQN